MALTFLLAGCTMDIEASYDLSAGGDGTGRHWDAVDWPDLPVSVYEAPDRLDVPRSTFTCGALDILFVIDNSGSMGDDQEKVAAEVPGFIDHLQEIGLGSEGGLHVGVVTTDGYSFNQSDCKGLGSLVTQTHSPDESDPFSNDSVQNCAPFMEGNRYMTELDDLEEKFTCASLVGAKGSGSERVIDATIEALDSWNGRPGGCNEGFSRVGSTNGDLTTERAALIVVMVTDEDDTDSIGRPTEWMEHLAFIRGGSLEDAAFIGIFPGDCSHSIPLNLEEFMEKVPYSFEESICSEDFNDIFRTAIPFVAEGCGIGWTPEG